MTQDQLEAIAALRGSGCTIAASARAVGVNVGTAWSGIRRKYPLYANQRRKRAMRIPGLPLPDFVVDRVCFRLGMDAALVRSPSRKRHLVSARTIIAVVLTRLGYSLPVTGMALGARDHTTVLLMRQRFDAGDYPDMPAIVERLTEEMRAASIL